MVQRHPRARVTQGLYIDMPIYIQTNEQCELPTAQRLCRLLRFKDAEWKSEFRTPEVRAQAAMVVSNKRTVVMERIRNVSKLEA